MKSSLSFILFIATAVNAGLLKSQIHEFARKTNLESRAMVDINGTNYFIGSEITLNWSDSLEFCNALGGLSLVSFETVEENMAVKNHLTASGLESKDYWISAKQVEPMLWMWVGSGQIISVFDWGVTQPDEVGSPVCVHLSQGAWYDDLCTLQKNFICQ